MPKIYPQNQRIEVCKLAQQGLSYMEIAKVMSEKFPEDWSAKYAFRSIPNILKDEAINVIVPSKTLDEMTQQERYDYIEVRLKTTPRFKLAFRAFGEDEKDVFVDEYLNVIRSTDSLTEAEEQFLFTAILELILAFQALNRKEQEEKWRITSLEQQIPQTDPRYRTHVDKRYQDEYDQHMRLYQQAMKQMKMSREQRLKEVRSQKKTLIDLAVELSTSSNQAKAIEEIERLSKLKDEELKRMLDEGYLYGYFVK